MSVEQPEEISEPADEVGVWASPGGSKASTEVVAVGQASQGAEASDGVSFDEFTAQLGVVGPDEVQTAGFAMPTPQVAVAALKRRRRGLRIAAAVVVVAGLVAGGVYVMLPGRTGNSVVAAVKCKPSGNLAGCLIKAPLGALQLTDSPAWDKTVAQTGDAYGKYITGDVSTLASDTSAQLTNDQGLKIVHTDWNAVDGNDVDLVVLSFSTQKGAQDWNDMRTGEILSAYRGQAVSIPGDSAAKAYFASRENTASQYQAAYSEVVGRLVLSVAYSSPNQVSAADLQNWAGTELASLRTAPKWPADPAAAASGTEQVACSSGLSSCLMPTPDGGQPWGYAYNNTHWISATNLTPNQLVANLWHGDSSTIQSEVMSDLTQNGVVGDIVHNDWGTNNFDDQGDIYLIQTLTQTGAGTLYNRNFGEPDWTGGLSGIAYTIPGEPQAESWYTNKPDSNGLIEYTFVANYGNVIIDGYLDFNGSFDSHIADEWAKEQLDRVSSTVHSQQMGLYSLNAPKLPAASQGTCSAPDTCLMSLPGQASDATSASDYDATGLVDSGGYSTQYVTSISSDYGNWLGADGFKSGSHRSWTVNGVTADAALLQFGSAAQARAAALIDYGTNAQGQIDCTDAAVPDSLCLAQQPQTSDPLQMETIRVVAWKGSYEVSVSAKASNEADVADAYTWLQQQLNRLP